MFKPFAVTTPFFAFLLLQYTFLPIVESNECIDVSSPKTRLFKNLIEFQGNKLPFDPNLPNSQGNYIMFSDKNIDTLYRNAFISYDSGHIIKLFLDSNKIRVIENGAFFSLGCLMTLNLQRNQIDSISKGTFKELTKLHELDLGENKIKEIPERVFTSNMRLKKLNITKNNLRVLHPDSFFRLSFLEELDLSYNDLRRIEPETFQYFGHLLNLQLGSNQFEHLELEKWTNLSNLTILNLSNNILESFDSTYDFNFSSTLTELYLNENLLTRLNPFGLRKHLPSLKLIDLDDNPWACLDLLPILRILNDSRISYKGSAESEPNVGGIACNRSIETYKKKKRIDVTTEISILSSTSPPNSAHHDDNPTESLYLTNVRILDSITNLQSIIVWLFVVIVVFIFIDVSVRSGCLTVLLRRRRNAVTLDNEDVENFSLLRERF